MQRNAITGAWAQVPDVPWATQDGTSFRELGGRTARLLDDLTAGIPGADRVGLAVLAVRVAELNAKLDKLANSELAVGEIFSAGTQYRPQRPALRAV